MFGEHCTDHRHLLTWRERSEILTIDRIVIVVEPDDANLHAAASLGGAILRLGVRLVVHSGTFDLTGAKSYARNPVPAWRPEPFDSQAAVAFASGRAAQLPLAHDAPVDVGVRTAIGRYGQRAVALAVKELSL